VTEPVDRLLRDFPEPDAEAWRTAAETLLRGVPLEKLLTPTPEGITLEPIYRADDLAHVPHLDSLPGAAPFLRGATPAGYLSRGWAVAQEIPYPDPAAFAAAAGHDLDRGQTDLPVRIGGAGGLSIDGEDDLARALGGIDLTRVPIHLSTSGSPLAALDLLFRVARERGISPDRLRGGVDADPVADGIAAGGSERGFEADFDELAELVRRCEAEAGPTFRCLSVDLRPWSDAGAHAVQELAFALAAGAQLFRELGARGVDAATVARRVRLRMAVGSTLLMEIAKLRALRLVWARLATAFGVEEGRCSVPVLARTSRWNRTAVDPWVNLLRGTVETFAAALGRVDAMHVAPFDEAIRPPDEFSRRIARNTQLVLQQESHLLPVIDPAGGSWAIERLTDQVARSAWGRFQAIEAGGGMLAALRAGTLQAEVAEIAEARRRDAAHRRVVQVGVNRYADPRETPLAPRSQDPPHTHAGSEGAPVEQGAAVQRGAGVERVDRIAPVAAARLSEPFEALRGAVNARVAHGGGRPRAFLANLGPVSQHRARADFATGFLEVGGFEVETNPGFDTPEAAGAAAAESGAPVVVICSTDDTYPELVPPLIAALKDAGSGAIVLLAGYPVDQIEALREAGVDDFVHARADCLALHTKLQDRLGMDR
jgi:methylmalonyl-CoA mutase